MSFFTSVEQFKNILLVRGYEDDGTPFSFKTSGDDIHVALYVKDKNGKSKFKTLDGEPTKELKFDSFAEANDFKKSYSNEFSFLGDFPFPNQYINQKNLSSSINTDLINIGLFDLECESKFGFPSVKEAKEVVTVISCYSTKSKILSCFALTDEDNKIAWNEDIKLNVVYCSSEKELLRRFLSYLREEKFDLISGWNSTLFDIPYLYNRMINVLSKKEADSLSFWGKVSVKEIEKMNKQMTKVYLLGTPHLDYLDVYKKFILKPRENYKLDTIAEIELKQKKLDYSEYESIQDFWEKNPSKFILYNLIDVLLLIRLEEKLKLLTLSLIFSFTAKQNFEDVFSPVKTWESLCYNYLYEQKIVVPKSFRGGKDESFAGAYVKEVPPGFYKDVISFDVTSLYPSLIQLLNVSPETLVTSNVDPDIQNRNLVSSLLNGELKEYNKHKELNLTLSANGQFYKKDRMGLIPKLMKELMDKRKEAKTKMIEYKKELEEINAQLKELN
jgi:DNA polymerase elongation subunit (family B)